MRRRAPAVLLAGYAGALGCLLAGVVGHLFWSLDTEGALTFYGTSGMALCFPGVVGWVLWPPWSQRKFAALATCVILGGIVFATDIPTRLRSLSDQLYVDTHRAALESFVSDIRAYGRIQSMTHGNEWYKHLNGTAVAFTEAGRDSTRQGQSRRPMLATVLERDSIDEARYREFGERLRELHFASVVVDGPVVRLGRHRTWESGLAHIPPAAAHIAEQGAIPGTSIALTRAVSGNWYWWYCCFDG